MRIVQDFQQRGDIGGIVLSIAIERDDPRRARAANAGDKRGALSGGFGVPYDAQRRPRAHRRSQHLGRRIAAAVVHANNFVGFKAVERGLNFRQQRLDIFRFIAHRDDDGNRRGKAEIDRVRFHSIRNRALRERRGPRVVLKTALVWDATTLADVVGVRTGSLKADSALTDHCGRIHCEAPAPARR
jgi:hypothetical protein